MGIAKVGWNAKGPVEPAAESGTAEAAALAPIAATASDVVSVSRPAAECSPPSNERPSDRPLHRLREVREQQGLALRRVAQLMGAESRVLRREELPTTDIPLSRLYQWQQALDVPVAELLVDSASMLSAPVLARARLVRIMKTVTALKEKAAHTALRASVNSLEQQMLEIMPELSGIHPWQAVGQRRSLEEFGRIAERPYSTDAWREAR